MICMAYDIILQIKTKCSCYEGLELGQLLDERQTLYINPSSLPSLKGEREKK